MFLSKIILPHNNCLVFIKSTDYQNITVESWRTWTLGSPVRNPHGSSHVVFASFSAYSTEVHKCQPMSFACLSVFLHVIKQEPLTWIIIKFDTNNFTNICWHTLILVKVGQKQEIPYTGAEARLWPQIERNSPNILFIRRELSIKQK